MAVMRERSRNSRGLLRMRRKAIMQSVTKGHITVGPDYLLVECNSKPRDRRLGERLEKSLGRLVEYQDTTHKPFDLDDLPEPSEEESGALDLNTLPEDARRELVEHMEQLYMNWMDERIPALQNRTPKEAVTTPEGRKKVADLINDWENSLLRMPGRQFEFDFNKLRKKLGSEEE